MKPIDDPFSIGAAQAMAPTGDNPVQGVEADSVMLDMSNADYHALTDVVSTSMLKKILRSPAHLVAAQNSNKAETASQRIGTAGHCAILESPRFSQEYITYTGRRAGKAWEGFQANNTGKSILSPDEYAAAMGMRAAIGAYKEFPLAQVILDGEPEKSILWTDAQTKRRCRVRPDLFFQGSMPLLLDVKTTDDCRPDAFIRQIGQLHYDLQAAMYIEGVSKFVGEPVPFYFVAVEIGAPHGVWVYEVSPTEDDEIYCNGLRKLRKGLQLYAHCLETNDWPGYANPFTASGMKLARWHLVND